MTTLQIEVKSETNNFLELLAHFQDHHNQYICSKDRSIKIEKTRYRTNCELVLTSSGQKLAYLKFLNNYIALPFTFHFVITPMGQEIINSPHDSSTATRFRAMVLELETAIKKVNRVEIGNNNSQRSWEGADTTFKVAIARPKHPEGSDKQIDWSEVLPDPSEDPTLSGNEMSANERYERFLQRHPELRDGANGLTQEQLDQAIRTAQAIPIMTPERRPF